MEVTCNRRRVGEVFNPRPEFKFFDEVFSLPDGAESLCVELTVEATHRPSLFGQSVDSRDLGVGLYEIAVC